MRRQQLRSVAKEAARLQGCACDAEYRVGRALGLDNVKILHDDWCPLYDAGRAYVIYNPRAHRGCER